ncbi:hypothetical protein PIB30_095530 [Stylosanthes scabra]|uniref:Uncharacterized protein n=1 Tax=Stylosanthes scabra TaxID=79078 RepID=A0ABU6UY87_9FABA|nr:hypothetical protein [Stylosanthes scabra]
MPPLTDQTRHKCENLMKQMHKDRENRRRDKVKTEKLKERKRNETWRIRSYGHINGRGFAGSDPSETLGCRSHKLSNPIPWPRKSAASDVVASEGRGRLRAHPHHQPTASSFPICYPVVPTSRHSPVSSPDLHSSPSFSSSPAAVKEIPAEA